MSGAAGPIRAAEIALPADPREVRRGLLIFVAAMMILPGMDAIAKHLAGSVSAGQLVLIRFLFQTVCLLPLVALRETFRMGPNLWIHVARGLLMVVGNVMFFIAIGQMPLADAIAIFFVEPLVLTLLAFLFLGEKAGWRRILAVLAGLAGSAAIIRPGFEQFGAVALLPLGSAVAFALFLVLTRRLSHDTGIFAMQFHVGVFGSLAMVPALWIGDRLDFAPLAVTVPTPVEWAWLFVLGAVATTAHLMIVQSIRLVGASMVAPFHYLEIVAATILGFVLFGDFPAPTVWLGIAVIVASGLYVFRSEKRAATRRMSSRRPTSER